MQQQPRYLRGCGFLIQVLAAGAWLAVALAAPSIVATEATSVKSSSPLRGLHVKRHAAAAQLRTLVHGLQSAAQKGGEKKITHSHDIESITTDQRQHRGPFETNHPGWTNPWAPVKRFRVMDEMDIVAPESSLGEMVQPKNQGNTIMSMPLYIPPDLFPDPFPDKNETRNRTMPVNATCDKNPGGWMDKNEMGCPAYQMYKWCTPDGKEGPDLPPGKIDEWGTGGISALSACCECGGGITKVMFGEETPLNDRRVDASMDRMPLHAYPAVEAPEDRIRPQPVVAPMDSVPRRFARYIDQVYERTSAPDLSGFSLEWFDNAPADASTVPTQGGDAKAGGEGGPKPRSSRLDATVDSGFGNQFKPSPYWPRSLGPTPQLYFVRWSGSLVILIKGEYTFRVDLDGVRTADEGKYTKTSIGGNEVDTTQLQPMELEPGAYCVQIDVQMFPMVQGVRFEYAGPDNQNRMGVVPSPMLYCNPSIPACVNPAIDACGGAKEPTP